MLTQPTNCQPERLAPGDAAPRDSPLTSKSGIRTGNVALHHSGSPTEAKANHGDYAGVVRAIQRYRMDTRGWADIAYNFLVCPHGVVYEGRGFGVRSAANGTNAGNTNYHAVCVLRHDATEQAKTAARDCIDEIRAWMTAGMPAGGQAPPLP